jgi:hypothetical protein
LIASERHFHIANEYMKQKKLVWEGEFKNIVNVGRFWLKFREMQKPFGIPLKERRTHHRISPGDIIQIANEFYLVDQVGARKIKVVVD